MEQNKLLAQAREAFIETFAHTPEEKGYMFANVYNNDVIFTTSKDVFDAFVNTQALIRKVISQLLGLAFLMVFFMAVMIYGGGTHNKILAYISVAAIIIICIIAIIANYSRVRQGNKWEAIYTKKGNTLIFDGNIFCEPNLNPVYPETAFF